MQTFIFLCQTKFNGIFLNFHNFGLIRYRFRGENEIKTEIKFVENKKREKRSQKENFLSSNFPFSIQKCNLMNEKMFLLDFFFILQWKNASKGKRMWKFHSSVTTLLFSVKMNSFALNLLLHLHIYEMKNCKGEKLILKKSKKTFFKGSISTFFNMSICNLKFYCDLKNDGDKGKEEKSTKFKESDEVFDEIHELFRQSEKVPFLILAHIVLVKIAENYR